MHANEQTELFCPVPSKWLLRLQVLLWGGALVFVIIGPYVFVAKLVFGAIWAALSVGYYRRYQQVSSLAQLRFSQGILLLVFNNGQEPQWVHFYGSQRVLPWLVELSLRLENGKVLYWPIAADCLDRQSFRRLKVFVATRVDALQFNG